MKTSTVWKEKMLFETGDGENTTLMDAKAPIGTGKALSPKQLALSAISGCTGIDIAAHMRKHKQNMKSLKIDADAPVSEGHPAVFKKVDLDIYFEGEIEPKQAIDSVVMSQTKYCGVSAMMYKNCPIHYRVHLNGQMIHEGDSEF